ncbi:hypothetical protein DPMN_075747 [Dreissena polymorpha]|uniref:Uncharacterized protein n=1 Tax=Dreissena polymorpha TaxID=45954 RepID=A0A9D3YMA9_DREPO|nr:hypothetical protein DPMN_075747 [Dreissena polymorpha]
MQALCIPLPALYPPSRCVSTCAQYILDEELGDCCVACATLITDNSEACDSCLGTCHTACVYRNGSSVTFTLCTANQSPINKTSNIVHNRPASPRSGADNPSVVATTHSQKEGSLGHNTIDLTASQPDSSSPARTPVSPSRLEIYSQS